MNLVICEGRIGKDLDLRKVGDNSTAVLNFPLAVNDLERGVFEGWPELARFRNALIEAGATRAMLSGSGSTVFGVFPAADRCERVSMRLREAFTGWTLVATRTVPGAVRFMPSP